MNSKKNILAIIGSASTNSSNLKLVKKLGELKDKEWELTIADQLNQLPHFNPEQSADNAPDSVTAFRNAVLQADGIIICTPEYIFSIPSVLKNVLEWCVAVSVFAQKPTGLITASASGQKGHEELQLIMKTLEAELSPATTLLIQGIKGKMDNEGRIIHAPTEVLLKEFAAQFSAALAH